MFIIIFMVMVRVDSGLCHWRLSAFCFASVVLFAPIQFVLTFPGSEALSSFGHQCIGKHGLHNQNVQRPHATIRRFNWISCSCVRWHSSHRRSLNSRGASVIGPRIADSVFGGLRGGGLRACGTASGTAAAAARWSSMYATSASRNN